MAVRGQPEATGGSAASVPFHAATYGSRRFIAVDWRAAPRSVAGAAGRPATVMWNHDLVGGPADVRVQRQQQPDTGGERRRAGPATKPGTEAGAMPAKVSVNARPTVTAGLAKVVDEVNQYAAPM